MALALDLRLPLLVVGAVVVATYSLRAATLLWVLLAGALAVPLYTVRDSAVYFSTAYLTVLLLFWGVGMLPRQDLRLRGGRLTLPLLTFGVVAVLSGIQGVLFYDPSVPGVHRFLAVQIYAVALVVLSVGAALLVGHQVQGVAALRWLYGIITGIAALMLIGRVIRLPLIDDQPWWPIAQAHGLTLLCARLLWDPPEQSWQRALMAGLLIYAVVSIVVLPFLFSGGQWVSGWLMLVPALGLLTLLRWKRAVTAVMLLSAGPVLYLTAPWIRRVIDIATREGDFHRVQLWQEALELLLHRPLLGVGPGNYIDYAMRYRYGSNLFGSAHGNYQQIGAEMGSVGLAALLWVLATAVVLGWRLFRTVSTPFLQAFSVGVLAALLAQMSAAVIGDYLVPAYHNGGHTTICATIYTWIALGSLIAIEATTGREARR
jgi:hypothetical protein